MGWGMADGRGRVVGGEEGGRGWACGGGEGGVCMTPCPR